MPALGHMAQDENDKPRRAGAQVKRVRERAATSRQLLGDFKRTRGETEQLIDESTNIIKETRRLLKKSPSRG